MELRTNSSVTNPRAHAAVFSTAATAAAADNDDDDNDNKSKTDGIRVMSKLLLQGIGRPQTGYWPPLHQPTLQRMFAKTNRFNNTFICCTLTN